MSEDNCARCIYFSPDEGGDDGVCRRYPPVPVLSDDGDAATAFPIVPADWWCGECRQKLH